MYFASRDKCHRDLEEHVAGFKIGVQQKRGDRVSNWQLKLDWLKFSTLRDRTHALPDGSSQVQLQQRMSVCVYQS